MLKVLVDYPTRAEERLIIDRMTGASLPDVQPVVSPQDILNARALVRQIYVDNKIKDYVLDLVIATRYPGNNGLSDLNTLIGFGASPRASINLINASKALAFALDAGCSLLAVARPDPVHFRRRRRWQHVVDRGTAAWNGLCPR